MKILIKLHTSNELICYEGVALAMILATFDHQVQLWIDAVAFNVILQKDSRIYGMLKSLPLYDLPPIWIDNHEYSDWFVDILTDEISSQVRFVPDNINLRKFDQVMSF